LLSETFQAFERLSGRHVRELGLTPAQFDVIATLGNTPGMSSKELGQRTLITKGTLTGVIDRLEERGFVERVGTPNDRRSIHVQLTGAGEREFVRVFGPHVAYCRRAFEGYVEADFETLDAHLVRMRDGFVRADRRTRRRGGDGLATTAPLPVISDPVTPPKRRRERIE
jgi:DNA-binding MarR family transcriptional regulator